jgi:hypothetical protein
MESVSLNATKPEFGIDKIRLHTSDFHLKTLDLSKGWEGKPATIRAGEPPEPWYVTGEGQQLTESVWYNNTSDAVVELSKRGLSVHYNPSTLDHQYHLTKDLQRSWEKVKKQLDGLGIQWNEEGSRITRTDLTKQNVMEHPSYVYTNALGLVKGKRMNSRTYGTNAVEVKNSQRALVCYDKTLQLREQKKVTNAPANLLRMEARWTSSKAVGALHTGLHLTNVGELVTASTAHLEDCYNKFLTNQVFRTDGQQLALDLVEEKETLAYYRANHERGAFKHYLASFGIPALVEKFGANLEALEHVLTDVGYSRTQVWRHLNELRESIRAYNHIQGLRGNTTPLGHLQHLQDTFTSPLHV